MSIRYFLFFSWPSAMGSSVDSTLHVHALTPPGGLFSVVSEYTSCSVNHFTDFPKHLPCTKPLRGQSFCGQERICQKAEGLSVLYALSAPPLQMQRETHSYTCRMSASEADLPPTLPEGRAVRKHHLLQADR